jgi:hypothetical protein
MHSLLDSYFLEDVEFKVLHCHEQESKNSFFFMQIGPLRHWRNVVVAAFDPGLSGHIFLDRVCLDLVWLRLFCASSLNLFYADSNWAGA